MKTVINYVGADTDSLLWETVRYRDPGEERADWLIEVIMLWKGNRVFSMMRRTTLWPIPEKRLKIHAAHLTLPFYTSLLLADELSAHWFAAFVQYL